MEPVDLQRERRLLELVEGTLQQPRDQREAFLSRPGLDPDLVADARAVLEARTTPARSILDRPSPLARAAAAEAAPAEGMRQIGNYQIEKQVGRGGMGVVYSAKQSEPVERRVAVKLLRSMVADQRDRARFAIEQNALARLSHPHIAQLYEAGATEEGRPFFAMELVDGEPLTLFAAKRRLDVGARLRLLIDVCRAVEHAHRRQLLHRDLKPSNVLVVEDEGRPVPKVIDFGIAKMLDAGQPTTGSTGHGAIGTPFYMSPEAIRGEVLDTRTDIYSLGVLLYELLCGSKPFLRGAGTVADVLRRVVEEPAQPPSQRLSSLPADDQKRVAASLGTTPAKLRVELKRDLDWIALKALAKSREERYGSATELADDLERYLDHRQVHARPPELGYRVRKLVLRHRTAVVAGAFVLAALIAAGLLSFRYAIDASRERAEADLARQQAEGLVTFLVDDLYEELEPLARRDFLERIASQAADYFEALPEDLYEASIVGHARALRNLGRVAHQQGDFESARESFQAALELDRRAVAQGFGDDAVEGLALDFRRMGDVQEQLGDKQSTLASVRRAIELREQLLELDPQSVDYREGLAYDLCELGWALRNAGDMDGAVDAFAQGTEMRRQLFAADADPLRQRQLGVSLKDLGGTLRMVGRVDDAAAATSESLELLDALHEAEPTRADYAAESGKVWTGYAQLLRVQGDLEAALEAAERGIELFERWLRADPSDARAQEHVAYGRLQYAKLLETAGRSESARRELERALAELAELTPDLDIEVIQLEALYMLGRDREARPLAKRIVAAGWHVNRPDLIERLREEEILQ